MVVAVLYSFWSDQEVAVRDWREPEWLGLTVLLFQAEVLSDDKGEESVTSKAIFELNSRAQNTKP